MKVLLILHSLAFAILNSYLSYSSMAVSSSASLLTTFHCSVSSCGTNRAAPTTVCLAKLSFSPKSNASDVKLRGGNQRLEKWRASVSFFPSFLQKKGKDKDALKNDLFEAIAPLDRGAEATEDDKQRVDEIARELESVNTVKEPLKSDLLNGKWELLYTTSRSILATQRPKFLRPNGKIYQAINADTLRAQNMETWPYFNQVTANLVPINSKRVAVRFDTFKILGVISIKAPGRGRGELEITYLDEDLRISRGDKGNLFVLKMVDPSYRVPL